MRTRHSTMSYTSHYTSVLCLVLVESHTYVQHIAPGSKCEHATCEQDIKARTCKKELRIITRGKLRYGKSASGFLLFRHIEGSVVVERGQEGQALSCPRRVEREVYR